jgi:uncharacterized protein (TIGR02246 family)
MNLPAMRAALLLVASAFLPFSASPQQTDKSRPETEVRAFLADFIRAFDNLDWDKFRMAFADDATVFYPRGITERADGRAQIENHFRQVFEQIRAGRSSGPYMDLQPRELKIQFAGPTAIVTFQLEDRPGFINRRTLILRKQQAGWRIIHLHASEVRMESNTSKP